MLKSVIVTTSIKTRTARRSILGRQPRWDLGQESKYTDSSDTVAVGLLR